MVMENFLTKSHSIYSHLNKPFHYPEGLQTGLIVYLFKLLNWPTIFGDLAKVEVQINPRGVQKREASLCIN